MALFGGPSTRDFMRLERHLENIERQLEKLTEQQAEHARRANGHPAKVIWHGMTWPQIIGLGLLIIVAITVVGEAVVLELIRESINASSEAVPVIQPLLQAGGIF